MPRPKDSESSELEQEEFTETQYKIIQVCDSLSKFLCEKNRRYGDSALNPVKIFSKLDASNSLTIRMDDKMSRIMNSKELRKNDVWDLFGYLNLLIISKGWEDPSEFLD
jgi:hypothetical protein